VAQTVARAYNPIETFMPAAVDGTRRRREPRSTTSLATAKAHNEPLFLSFSGQLLSRECELALFDDHGERRSDILMMRLRGYPGT
jgi:hypothetical protein